MSSSNDLEVLDYVLLCGYFVVVMCVGLFATYRANRGNTEGFFLAGKSMTWLPIAGSIFATNIGAPMFVGISGSAASVGIAPVMFEWHATYTLIMLGWIFVPIYMASGTYTMPEYLKKRYGGHRLRVFYAFVQLLLTILTGISAELYAGSLFIKQILGWNIYLSTIAILLITSVYTIGGGLTAVIYTDALQTVILIAGSTVLAILSLTEVGGYEQMAEQFMWSASNNSFYYESPNVGANLSCGFVPDNSFHIMRGVESDYPWPGLVFGLTLLATYYWCTNQIIVQRNLSAKNMTHSKMACVTASFLKLLPFILFVIPGMISRILFADEIACTDPDFCEEICDNPSGCTDIAYPLLVLRIMPIGMKGVMLAAMLAALMSSLTSQYNSSSSIFSMDIWKFYRRRASDKELVIVGRLFGGCMVLLSIGWLPILQMLQGTRLWDYIQSVSAYITPPWVVVFIMGMFWSRATEQGAFWSVIVGLIIGGIRMFIDFSNPGPDCGSGDPDNRPSILTDVHYLHFAIISAGVALVVLVCVSIVTKPRPPEKLHKVMWQTRLSEKEPELTDDEGESDSDDESIASEDLTKCRRFYNLACGFSSKTAPKLTKEEKEEHLRKMHDITEDSWTSRVCDISAVIAVAATCGIIGFYA